ncbi:RagB/SusD family nutrient uptake outer membrane protein [Myxococcaceae bacterium GXIMD 01537]
MRFHHLKKTVLAFGTVLSLGGCGSLEVPDLNNPSLDSYQKAPTRSAVMTGATGLLIGHRVGVAATNGYVAHLGILGRESYTFDGSDPRFVTEMLAAPLLDPGSPAFGGNFWANPYANIRNAHLLIDALEKVPGVTDTEKEAIRGFAKTFQALDFLVIINTRDTNGAPIDVNRPLGELAPIESKDAVFAHIAKLLDEAQAHLQAGGDTFPFPLSTGYKGFDKPATFIKFNRAVKARVDVYRGKYDDALADLALSFIDSSPTGDLSQGVFHTFQPGSGEVANDLISKNIYAHPSTVIDADKRANGEVDLRVSRKVLKTTERASRGLKSDLAFNIYPTNSTPVPIIRNEELILLRAEANIGARQFAAAADDINLIRTRAGGLEPRFDMNEGNILDELLKQKRYSLLLEGGHRWIDARRYGKLSTLPVDLEGHRVHERFPLPLQESDGRQQ